MRQPFHQPGFFIQAASNAVLQTLKQRSPNPRRSVSRGRNGFRKDKSGEKLAESEEDLLEHRTDGSDAFDTLYIGCEKFPFRDSFSLNMGGVI